MDFDDHLNILRNTAKSGRKARLMPAEGIPNPFTNLNRQVGVINASPEDPDYASFVEMRADEAILEGLVPLPFEGHVRLFGK